MIIRPQDPGPLYRIPDTVYCAEPPLCSASRYTDDCTWICTADAPAIRPADDDPPSRRRDYGVNKPADDPEAPRLQDNNLFERPANAARFS